MAAIQDKNLEAAPGKLGERSDEVFEYVIKYKGKLTKPEEYENIAIRANADGSVLHLKDVARVELGAYSYSKCNAFKRQRRCWYWYYSIGRLQRQRDTNSY